MRLASPHPINAGRWAVERYQTVSLDGWRLIRRDATGGSKSRFFRHRADAEAELAAYGADGTCRECGDVLAAKQWIESVRKRVLARKLCHSCLHWSDLAAKADDPSSVRVDGRHYWIEPDDPVGQRRFSGFAGRRFDIHFHDGRRVVSHNLWTQGIVPDRFRDRLPDNATFATHEATP